jgi:predicted nucleotidyltransferase
MLKELDKYRLDDIQKKALKNVLQNVEGEIYLFGSRTDLTKRGGDVDILIMSENVEPLKLKWELQTRYLMEADESIDIIVYNKSNLSEVQKAFLNSINKVRIN